MTITRLARETTNLPIIANGGIHIERQGRSVLTEGEADLIALGRGALANPDWPRRLANGQRLNEFDSTMLKPDVTLNTQTAWEPEQGDFPLLSG